MSVTALKPTLSAIAADGHITSAEAITLTSPKNLEPTSTKTSLLLSRSHPLFFFCLMDNDGTSTFTIFFTPP